MVQDVFKRPGTILQQPDRPVQRGQLFDPFVEVVPETLLSLILQERRLSERGSRRLSRPFLFRGRADGKCARGGTSSTHSPTEGDSPVPSWLNPIDKCPAETSVSLAVRRHLLTDDTSLKLDPLEERINSERLLNGRLEDNLAGHGVGDQTVGLGFFEDLFGFGGIFTEFQRQLGPQDDLGETECAVDEF